MRKLLLGALLTIVVGSGVLLSVAFLTSKKSDATQVAAQNVTWSDVKECYRDPSSCPPPPPPPPPKDG